MEIVTRRATKLTRGEIKLRAGRRRSPQSRHAQATQRSPGPGERHGTRPTLEIGPQMIINVEDQLHQETTKSHGSQSISMTTTSHQVFSCSVRVLPRFQGHWEPGDVIPMLMSDPGSILHEARNLQPSMTSTRFKTTTKPRRYQSSESKYP